jgi:hypothetical protein
MRPSSVNDLLSFHVNDLLSLPISDVLSSYILRDPALHVQARCEAGRDGQDTARRMRAETESDFDDERKEPIRGAKEGRSPEREAHSRAAPDR